MTQESNSEKALARQFPMLYITLVSIVIALAVERLLGHVSDLGLRADFASLIVILQCAQFILITAVFWWVSTRWVSTIPWKFSFFDSASMLMMLIGLDLMRAAVGTNFSNWLLVFGFYSAANGYVYRKNGRNGMILKNISVDIVHAHLLPTRIMYVSSAVYLSLGLMWAQLEPGEIWQLPVVVLTLANISLLGVTDYRVWHRAVEAIPEPGPSV